MEHTIVGYQFDPVSGRFCGEYVFPNNLDKEEIYLPPNTTLVPPPVCEAGKVPYMKDGVWVIGDDPLAHKPPPKINDYLMITETFIAILKDQGCWTEEDQQKRDAALLAYAAAEAEKPLI